MSKSYTKNPLLSSPNINIFNNLLEKSISCAHFLPLPLLKFIPLISLALIQKEYVFSLILLLLSLLLEVLILTLLNVLFVLLFIIKIMIFTPSILSLLDLFYLILKLNMKIIKQLFL